MRCIRQTFSEAAINTATADPLARQRLLAEERGAIEAERIAGMFVPEGEEVP